MRLPLMAILIAPLFLLASCSHHPAQTNTSVNHVVLLWLKPGTSQSQIDNIIKYSNELRNIEGVYHLQLGPSIPSTRKIVDDSFDLGIYMRFNSIEEMNQYLKHPRHVDLVNKHIKPNIRKIIVYDF